MPTMPHKSLHYEEPAEWSREAVEQALRDGDAEALLHAVIAIALRDADWRYAQDLCVRLCDHADARVRGNAIVGFGHVARVHRRLDRDVVQPIVQAALSDASEYVRGQAVAAADDTAQFLGWQYERRP
jgi:hypothetical protein